MRRPYPTARCATPVIGRKNFYGSGARWAADLAAGIWTITATAAQNDLEPLPLLTDYLTACAETGGTPPAGADLEPFLPWTPAGRARRTVPAGDPARSRPVTPATSSRAIPRPHQTTARVTVATLAIRNVTAHGFTDYLPKFFSYLSPL